MIKDISHLVDMPLPWAPKLYIDKEQFLRGPPMGEVTRFYSKSRVDTYTKYMQIDGLTTRLAIYADFNRTLVKEIRCIYSNRRNNLFVRQRFPYEFKTIEYYKPNFKQNYKPAEPKENLNLSWPHWRKIEEIDRRLRIIDFYSYRHEDGLVKRIDELGVDWPGHRVKINKTKEFFEGRDDWLTYRSFKYIVRPPPPKDGRPSMMSQSIDYKDLDSLVYNVDTSFRTKGAIVKMQQRFEKNPSKDGHKQVAKMVIDLKRDRITVWFHLNEGEIAPIVKEYERKYLQGAMANTAEGNDAAQDNPEEQARRTEIYSMEKECFQQIKNAEKTMLDEISSFRDGEEQTINTYKQDNNLKAALEKILEKSLSDKAREKYRLFYNRFNKDLQKTNEQAANESLKDDILAMYLEDKSRLSGKISQAEAKQIKQDIIKNFKQRIFSRADIIEKRISEEKRKLDQLMKKKDKKQLDSGDDKKEDDQKTSQAIEDLSNSVKILENRAERFQNQAVQDYKNLNEKIMEDPRLAALHQKDSHGPE